VPHFDPHRSTTHDIVRQAVIPLSIADEYRHFSCSLSICIVGAKIKNGPQYTTGGIACSCEITGRPDTRSRTSPSKSLSNPVWLHHAEVDFCTFGESLSFRIFDVSDSDNHFGCKVLRSMQFYKEGFFGTVVLAAGCNLTVKIKVTPHNDPASVQGHVMFPVSEEARHDAANVDMTVMDAIASRGDVTDVAVCGECCTQASAKANFQEGKVNSEEVQVEAKYGEYIAVTPRPSPCSPRTPTRVTPCTPRLPQHCQPFTPRHDSSQENIIFFSSAKDQGGSSRASEEEQMQSGLAEQSCENEAEMCKPSWYTDVICRKAATEKTICGRVPKLGHAYATVAAGNRSRLADRMVTHTWENKFCHLVSALIADALEAKSYNRYTDLLLA